MPDDQKPEKQPLKPATKPRLVIATDNFLPRWDGIARFLGEIIPRLLQEYDITVISPDYGLSVLDAKVTRVLIPTSSKRYGDYTPAQWKPDAIDYSLSFPATLPDGRSVTLSAEPDRSMDLDWYSFDVSATSASGTAAPLITTCSFSTNGVVAKAMVFLSSFCLRSRSCRLSSC